MFIHFRETMRIGLSKYECATKEAIKTGSLFLCPDPFDKQSSLFLNSAIFDLTFESLIVADEVSLNGKRGARNKQEKRQRHHSS